MIEVISSKVYTLFAQATVKCPSGTTSEVSGCSGNTGLPKVNLAYNNVQVIFQLIFGILGATAVIVILISAIKLITAQGEPDALAKARQTIIYASVGLVVALSGEVIVSLLLGAL
jgi:hypothetical protein